MSFAALGLSEAIARAVSERGYTQPTPIQAQAIPVVLEGGDLLAGAQTGTGKTAGFTLPILQRLSASALNGSPGKGKAHVRALVLVPTRELAAQVEESVREYGKYLPLKSMMMFGGVSINPQIAQLRAGVDILVATPGRLLDHVGQKTVDLSRVEILVLDEADRMLDMGFIRDIKKILALLPRQRQNLLFSATFSDEIKALADNLLNKPAMVEVARRNAANELVEQRVYPVDREKKRALLAHLIKQHNWFQVLVFTRTKHGANRLAEQLGKDGIPALAIHGNKSQAARTRALAEFKTGKLQVLVATDIAARGIDISELPHVVNYELPNVPEDYVHRIGRTGRAGSEGEASSLVCVDEHKLLRDIERLITREIPVVQVPGFEPDPTIKAEPIANRQNRGGGQGKGNGQGRNAQGRNGARGTAGGQAGGQKQTSAQSQPREQRQPAKGGRAGSGRGQPASNAGTKPAGNKPAGNKPAHGKSAGGKPAAQGYGRPAVSALLRSGGRGR
jgi:ATP-dependent RNA helicase RhlE